jgi:shikimate dehydrogenase
LHSSTILSDKSATFRACTPTQVNRAADNHLAFFSVTMPTLNGETRLHVIVGDPVGQTKSPAGLTAEFAAREVDAVCVPVHITAEDFDTFMAAAKRIRNLDGIVVTIPHKFSALRHCDEVSERARVLGSVNVLYRIADERWRGDMTDGVAMAAAIEKAGCKLRAGARC